MPGNNANHTSSVPLRLNTRLTIFPLNQTEVVFQMKTSLKFYNTDLHIMTILFIFQISEDIPKKEVTLDASSALSQLQVWRAKGQLCDFTIVSQDRTPFQVHKFLAASSSGFFKHRLLENPCRSMIELPELSNKVGISFGGCMQDLMTTLHLFKLEYQSRPVSLCM